MKNLIFIILLFAGTHTVAQINIDSLNNVWADETKLDSIRYKAAYELIWKGYLFSRPDTAFYLAEELISDARKSNNSLWVAKGLKIKGVSFSVRGSTDTALKYFKRSVHFFKSLEANKDIGGAYMNVGLAYKGIGNLDSSIYYYNKSLTAMESVGDRLGEAQVLASIGSIFILQGQQLLALDYINNSAKTFIELEAWRSASVSHNDIGAIYYDMGQLAKALEYYKKALFFAKEDKHESQLATSLVLIGMVYKSQKEHDLL